MMYFLSVVLIGTVYPIFLEVITSEKISVGPPFFNKLIIPFLIPFLFAMAHGPQLKWIKADLENKRSLFFYLLISLMLSVFIIRNLDVKFLLNSILITAALYLFFVTLRDLVLRQSKNFSQKIAHFGFSLFILSILLNNIFSTEIITNLKVGETFQSDELKINFKSVNKINQQNYEAIVGEFKIEDSDGKIVVLNPELRIYNQPNIITSEADIKTNLVEDKFITMNVVNNQEYFNIRYQIKPYMFWIWLSVLLISLGGIRSLFKNKYEK